MQSEIMHVNIAEIKRIDKRNKMDKIWIKKLDMPYRRRYNAEHREITVM